MSLIILKVVGSLILSFASLFIAKRMFGNKDKFFSISNMIGILFMILPGCLLYQEQYNSLVSIITFIIYIIVFKKIFNVNIIPSIVVSSYIVILIALMDLIGTSIELRFFSYNFVRTNVIASIINNCCVSIAAILVSNIPIFKKKITSLCSKIYSNNYLKLAIFTVLIIIVISLLYYNITSIFKLNTYYTITVISICICIILSYIYIDEKNNYQKLSDEYNSLFDYTQNFENWIDDEQMYRHELKNNLSIIRSLTKNKKIIDKVDEMLKFSIIIDDKAIEDLKNVPKGGLKGLLYYKVALAKNKNVKMIVEVSPKVSNIIKKIPTNKLRNICIVLGIYLDNALETAEMSNNKTVSLEIYEVNKKLNFTISNSYNKLISIKQMKKKGFTTKGKNHGKGLYYVNKLINKYKWIETSQMFLNNYFIQKITIK